MRTDAFRVLHVCVGNVCRSVLAEHLMRDAARRRQEPCLVVSSAGMQAVPGNPMHPHIEAILAGRGISAENFRTTRFSPAAVLDADLILTATRAERNLVVAAKPAALRRTFTLNEFARLAPAAASDEAATDETVPDGADRRRLVVARALTLRGYVTPTDPSCDDIPDPTPTLQDFTACAATVATAVDAIVDALQPDSAVRYAAAESSVVGS